MLVRPARLDEVAALVDVSRRVQERLTASGSLQQFGPIPYTIVAAHSAAGTALALDDDGALIGGVLVEPDTAPVRRDLETVFAAIGLPPAGRTRWYLQKLMIAPERQGDGLGNLLLDGARQLVRERGGGLLALDCWAGNEKLRAFYTAAGFTLHGEFAAGGFDVAAFTWSV
jgi:GNAT superfamily N-acetyltransferase